MWCAARRCKGRKILFPFRGSALYAVPAPRSGAMPSPAPAPRPRPDICLTMQDLPLTTLAAMSPEDMARTRLAGLRRQHREMDEAIAAMAAQGTVCSLTLGRLKRSKLALKDQIARLEDELTPDIIA